MKSKSTPASKKRLIPLRESWQPDADQKRAVAWLLKNACAGVFADPGVGKTAITLAAIKILKKKKMLRKVLVVAPKKVCLNVWPNEVNKWAEFFELKLVVLHGPKKEERLKEDADIYVTNPESLQWLLDASTERSPSGKSVRVGFNAKRWKKLGFDTLVVDELSKFKHVRSQRSKVLKQVLHTFSRRWGLTGSPAANHMENLFGEVLILDLGRSFGSYITHFRNEYFVPSYDGFSFKLKEGAKEKMFKKIAPLVLRIEAPEGPEIIPREVYVELPDDVRKIYDDLEDDFLAKIEDNYITAGTAAVASNKLRQVCSGGIYLDEEVAINKNKKIHRIGERRWAHLHEEKLDMLENLIEELQGRPLLGVYEFRHELEALKMRFGKDIPYIGGGTTEKQDAAVLAEWNAGRLPYLFGQPNSMGHGLNMQDGQCNQIAILTLPWDFELYDQVVRRVARRGNRATRVYVHHIMAQNTLENRVLWALRGKRRGQDELFEALKSYRRTKKVL